MGWEVGGGLPGEYGGPGFWGRGQVRPFILGVLLSYYPFEGVAFPCGPIAPLWAFVVCPYCAVAVVVDFCQFSAVCFADFRAGWKQKKHYPSEDPR